MGKGGARERAQFSAQPETKPSGLCDDADAPSEVTAEQLEELGIAVVDTEAE